MITLSAASAHNLPLPNGTVHCVVTSPPYYSLRKYQGEQAIDWPAVSYAPMPGLEPIEIVGCDPGCEHEWADGPRSSQRQRSGAKGGLHEGRPINKLAGNITLNPTQGAYCQRCGGWRGALGLEPTPEAYIAHLVLCFREIRRVLRDDGCAWIVMGDSYAGSNATQGGDGTTSGLRRNGRPEAGRMKTNVTEQARRVSRNTVAKVAVGLQQGDLMLIPHRLALALQGDGWTCRNDVVWAKKSPMPESVAGWRWEQHKIKVKNLRGEKTQSFATGSGRNDGDNPGGGIDQKPWAEYKDCPGCPKCSPHDGYVLRRGSWRHTRSHEFIFQLVKSMGYFCDQEKVREASTGQSGQATNFQRETKDHLLPGQAAIQHRIDREPTSDNGKRNPRSVLTPRPESYPGAHYAVFPSTLIAPLIRASCPAKCCPECGAAWAACIERESSWQDRKAQGADSGSLVIGHNAEHGKSMSHDLDPKHHKLLGYRPTCDCAGHHRWTKTLERDRGRGSKMECGRCRIIWYIREPEPWPRHKCHIPGTVLDPFVGSGTALQVARELGLSAIGLDLSPSYLDEHAKVRIGRTPSRALETLPLFKEEI